MADSSSENLFKKYVEKMKRLTENGDEEQILNELSSGKNTYMKMSRLETSSYDPAWINKIEGVIFDLGEIIANPREVTQSIGDISPIELAKKIKGESVQHLASHTQYIKEVDDYGNVIPSKILSFYNEENIITYENRFIATFIRKLLLFIEKRYEFAVKFARLHDQETLYLKNHSFVDGAEVEIETKVKIVSESQTAASKANNAYFARIEEVREYVRYYYNSPFMKIFKTENNVRNPIVLTNILRKNPKYRHCYEVYKYLESYTGLGIDYRMDENYDLLTDEELAELNFSLFGSYLSAHGKKRSNNVKHRVKIYKPKVLTSMDDETFVYGPLLEGPLQFVRVDEGYQRYLESMVPQDLPLHPHKKVREYYAEQYQERKDYRRWLQERDALLRRKQREVRNFELEVEDVLGKREAEKLRLAELEKALIQKEEEDALNRVRRQIIEAALRDRMMDTPPDEAFDPANHIGPMLGEGEPVIQIHQSDVEWDPNDIIPNQEVPNYFHPGNHTGEGALDSYHEGTLTPPGEEVEELKFKDPSEYEKKEPIPEEAQPVETPVEEEEIFDDDALIDVMDEQKKKEEELVAAIEEAQETKPKPAPVRSLLGTYGVRNGKQIRYVVRKIRPDQHANGHLVDPKQPRTVEEPVENKPLPPEEALLQSQDQVSPVDGSILIESAAEASNNVEVNDQVEASPFAVNEQPGEQLSTPPRKRRYVVRKIRPDQHANGHLIAPLPPTIIKIPAKKANSPESLQNAGEFGKEPGSAANSSGNLAESASMKKEKPTEGSFVVKTLEGYYVEDGKYTMNKSEAKVFHDFNKAYAIKVECGGKVVKI